MSGYTIYEIKVTTNQNKTYANTVFQIDDETELVMKIRSAMRFLMKSEFCPFNAIAYIEVTKKEVKDEIKF